MILIPRKILTVVALLFAAMAVSRAAAEPGFTDLFDGQTLKGWTLIGKRGEGYGVKSGLIYCAKGGGGKLMTEKEFSNFILRFDFKLDEGSNNGIGIRAPMDLDSAYSGMEIQVLDDYAPKHAAIRPAQYHGSIYDVFPAKRGALKKAGEWNSEEILADGRHVKVTLNGQVIVDANLNDATNATTILKHPGLFREHGHIGFLGHNDYVEFKNIRVKELPSEEKDNTAPEGFTALFNGKDLSGWKGLLRVDNPFKRAKLSSEETQKLQEEANANMREHWKVENGEIVFDGKGRSLCTLKDYGDFELWVDWKIPPHADSGIYLRGSPQVQIWDPYTDKPKNGSEVGSGGLYNNKKNPSKPTKVADKPIGQWNRFRILMVGEKVHVFLNGEQVVNATVLENYWDYSKPIFSTGQIELQNHGDKLWFKNIYIRELPRAQK
ncbi:MAG TPA: DUF1080 domain-containing protein [Candidatus Saccharimonadales bacterium]|nr:DUF1080 domain-containing protein [Candidatus Saccharimonadales bacterium]